LPVRSNFCSSVGGAQAHLHGGVVLIRSASWTRHRLKCATYSAGDAYCAVRRGLNGTILGIASRQKGQQLFGLRDLRGMRRGENRSRAHSVLKDRAERKTGCCCSISSELPAGQLLQGIAAGKTAAPGENQVTSRLRRRETAINRQVSSAER
jgi:hypothetical protein